MWMVHQPHSLSVWSPPATAIGTRQPAAARARGQGAAQPPWPGGDYLTSHAKQTRARGGASLFLRWPALDWTPRPRALRVRCGAAWSCSRLRLRDVAAVSVRSITHASRRRFFCFAFRRRASFSLYLLPCRCKVLPMVMVSSVLIGACA